MYLEKIFGSLFGIIWLMIFVLAILSLLVWRIMKKDKTDEIVEEKSEEKTEDQKEYIKENYKGYSIEENNDGKFDVVSNGATLKIFDSIEDSKVFVDIVLLKEHEVESAYEIVEIDGSFKVRKRGSERTIRKFATLEEAEGYVREKENND